jgi:3-hydroxyacyl-CoA dehydrogenase/enoyl-CoA hydratase/3-hydroxybutyryl-CoA epimerase
MLSLRHADGVSIITLDAPDTGVNTVSPSFIEQMIAAFEGVRDDQEIKGVVITSAKKGFMAGADLNFMLHNMAAMSPAAAYAFSQRATSMHRLIETCGKPVVAAMNGFALGGGYELALACHRRILADHPAAKVGLPEVGVGLLPGSGGTQRLPRLISVSAALDVLLDGRGRSPGEALALGMVDEVVPAEELIDRAIKWLADEPATVQPWDVKGFKIPESDGLLKQSTAALFTAWTAKLHARYGSNYPAPISILASVFEGVQVPFDTGLRVESRYFAHLLTGSVARNIIRTTFVNKSLAEKGARRPEGIPASKIGRVGILGAGMMGAGIAWVSASAGIEVILLDTAIEAAEKGKGYSRKLAEKAVESGRLGRDDADVLLARIQPAIDYAQLAGVELVVEAVFEDTAIKAEVTRKAEAVVGPGTIFATNTSTLPITQLSEASSRPDRFIGLHFFSPVDRMALVEVIMGKRTGTEALAAALDFVRQIGKTPIVVNDSRGFYTSRVFQTFIHEGMELLREGVPPALIENVAKQAGMPVGPLAVTDEVTLDLPLKIVRESKKEDPSYEPPTSLSVLETMVEKFGRRGRKSGGGFYDYGADGKKRLWTGLSQLAVASGEVPSAEDVRKRLLYVQALETARCLEEGVLTHAADADLGSVFGWGYPSWTGGTLSLIDTVGLPAFVAECDSLAQRYGGRFAPTAQLRRMAEEGTRFHA